MSTPEALSCPHCDSTNIASFRTHSWEADPGGWLRSCRDCRTEFHRDGRLTFAGCVRARQLGLGLPRDVRLEQRTQTVVRYVAVRDGTSSPEFATEEEAVAYAQLTEYGRQVVGARQNPGQPGGCKHSNVVPALVSQGANQPMMPVSGCLHCGAVWPLTRGVQP